MKMARNKMPNGTATIQPLVNRTIGGLTIPSPSAVLVASPLYNPSKGAVLTQEITNGNAVRNIADISKSPEDV